MKIARKTWPVTFKKRGSDVLHPKFLLGIFECTKCKSRFRSRIQLSEHATEVAKISDLAKKVAEIRNELIQVQKTLHAKISEFETERHSFVQELGDLQEDAEFRAEALESEVSRLREEIKSLKELLGSGEKEPE